MSSSLVKNIKDVPTIPDDPETAVLEPSGARDQLTLALPDNKSVTKDSYRGVYCAFRSFRKTPQRKCLEFIPQKDAF